MDYVENIELPQFSADAACAAARVDLARLRELASRRWPALAGEVRVDVFRSPGSFSFRQILHTAIAAELVKFGFAPERADLVAARFSEVGEGDPGEHDEVITKARLPGRLFPFGVTILIARHDSDGAKVVNVGRNSPSPDTLINTLWPEEAVVHVSINAVDRRIRSALGLRLTRP